MSRTFQKKIEDFKCMNCGYTVLGSGYTNHCLKCLYSKHVDINPGDRLNTCGGIMQPISFEKKGDDYILIHKCLKCGAKKRNKTAKDDNFDILLSL